MSETTTNVASETAEASVLNGVRTTPDRPAAPRRARPTTAERNAAKAKAEADANRAANATGVSRYGPTYVPPRAMVGFTKWIAREYPELKIDLKSGRDARLVSIASKAYRYFQSSDLNV